MMDKAIQLLKSAPFFSRNRGADHFLLHSINQPLTYFVHRGCVDLYKLCFNCTKLSIDTYEKGMFSVLDDNDFMTNKWLSIPFPSNFHNSKVVDSFPFVGDKTKREFAISFMGTESVTARQQRNLRVLLRRECKAREKDCLLRYLDTHESHARLFDSAEDRGPYARARLCLMPGGDFPTRKGVLDALFAGCIPVTFQLSTAQHQWPLHWGSLDTAMDSMIYIPRENVMKNVSNVFDQLISISCDLNFLAAKRALFSSIALRMQYNLPSGRGLRPRNAFHNEGKGRAADGEPYRHDALSLGKHSPSLPSDAVDVVLEHLLG
jgi:hypothetical protein